MRTALGNADYPARSVLHTGGWWPRRFTAGPGREKTVDTRVPPRGDTTETITWWLIGIVWLAAVWGCAVYLLTR
jgi:hypothetical protein